MTLPAGPRAVTGGEAPAGLDAAVARVDRPGGGGDARPMDHAKAG